MYWQTLAIAFIGLWAITIVALLRASTRARFERKRGEAYREMWRELASLSVRESLIISRATAENNELRQQLAEFRIDALTIESGSEWRDGALPPAEVKQIAPLVSMAWKRIAPKLGWQWLCVNCGDNNIIVGREVGYVLPSHITCNNCRCPFEVEADSLSGEEESKVGGIDGGYRGSSDILTAVEKEAVRHKSSSDSAAAVKECRDRIARDEAERAEKRKNRRHKMGRRRRGKEFVNVAYPTWIAIEGGSAKFKCDVCEAEVIAARPSDTTNVGIVCDDCGSCFELRTSEGITEHDVARSIMFASAPPPRVPGPSEYLHSLIAKEREFKAKFVPADVAAEDEETDE